jgi:uncharacterized membrane protein
MKLKALLKNEWPQLVLLAVPFLVLVPLWDKFPARIAIHWGLSGKPDGWAGKERGLLLVPVMSVGLALLFAFLPRFDARVKSYGPETQASLQRVTKGMGLATVTFMNAVALLIDAVALGWKMDMPRVVTLGTLILFAVLGNYMPKLRPNRFVGIRTPWTLKSPEVWIRTHRLFGSIMLVGSLALMAPCVFLPSAWGIALLLVFVLLVGFGSMVYSYRIQRN